MDVVPQLTVLVSIAFVLVQFFNFQAAVGPDSPLSLGLFRSTVSNQSAKYPVPVTPAGYTFSIWSVIYPWLGAWLIYANTTLCRTNAAGPVYLNPPVNSAGFLLATWLTLTCNVTWLFCWDREVFPTCTVVNAISAVGLYVAIAIVTSRTYYYLFVYRQYGTFDLWAERVLVHNGVAIYMTWQTVATTIGLSTTLIYAYEVDEVASTYISLGLLGSLLITYFFIDCFLYDRFTRYVLIVYPAAMWALGGILVANISKPNSAQAVLASTLFALVFVFFVIKTVLVIVRDPVYVIAKQRKASGEDVDEVSSVKSVVAYSRMV